MGYTHYYGFNKVKPIKGKQSQIEKQYQLAVRQCQRIVRKYQSQFEKGDERRLSGFSAHTKLNDYLGLEVNGCRGNDCETFSFRDHWSANGSEFCKTRQYYYDTVVVACLITMKHYMGDLFQVESDGDASDWVDGLELARTTLRIKSLNIPASIRRQLQGRLIMRRGKGDSQ